MKLQVINENMTARLSSMYYDRLKSVLGDDFPNCELEPLNDRTGGKGWIAKLFHKERTELQTSIGSRNKEKNLLIYGIGEYNNWSSLKSALLRLVERWEKRIATNKRKQQKLDKQLIGVREFLDEKFATDVIGEYKLEIPTRHGRYHPYGAYHFYEIGRELESFLNHRYTVENILRVRVYTKVPIIGAPYETGIALRWSLSPWHLTMNLTTLESLVEFLNLCTDKNSIYDLIKSENERYIDYRDTDINKYSQYASQLFTTLMTGNMPPDRFEESDAPTEKKEIKETIFDRIKSNLGRGVTSHYNNQERYNTTLDNQDYGLTKLSFYEEQSGDFSNNDYITMEIDIKHFDTIKQDFTTREIDRMISSNTLKDTISSIIDDKLLESVRYNNKSLILEETDNIDEDIINMTMEILQPILTKFPDITIRRGTQISQSAGRQLVILTKPTPPNELALLFNYQNQLLIGKPGGRYQAIASEEDLFNGVKKWVESKSRPPRPRRQRQETRPGTQPEAQQHNTPESIHTHNVDKSDYFPRTVHHLNRKIPGHQVSGGKSFTLAIHAKNIDFPPDIFAKLNLHYINKHEPNLIGWIGGTIDKNNKTMHVDEIQSDLMQRTIEMTNQERFRENIAKSTSEVMSDLTQTRKELARLKQQTYATATERFRLVELIQNKINEIEDLKKKSYRVYKLSDYSGYKSRVENTFKKWIQAFYHSAFNRARQLGLTDVYIISSGKIRSLWGSLIRQGAEDDTSIYSRVYDNMAKQLGAVDAGDWWHIKLDDVPFSESRDLISKVQTITEGVDREILAQWLEHAGITIDSIKGNFPDIDFDRLSMVVTKIENGETKIIQDTDDLSPDSLHRALSFIQREDLDLPIESTEFEVDELERDASLLITAYKIIDGVPYGLAFYSLDDPREPRYDSDIYDADDNNFSHLSDSDLFGDEDELEGMWNKFDKD